ncbi:MAG: N-acetylmuramoyl-L-alanine amidase [Oliverpabstia sp.]|nr:N-acetylmuramoyl-L-alanine amidase [Oliverpabstia sp.]
MRKLQPAHGGSDPGKIGVHKEKEKDINLEISLKVREKMEKENIRVVLTREKDEDLADEGSQNKKIQDLKNRCEIIHQTQPDCVVSIHQNSYPDEKIKGAQVFYYEDSKEGKRLGEIMQKNLVEGLDKTNHRQAKGNRSYYLLKKTDATLVIVECGFISNSEESTLLSSGKYQEQVAQSIVNGIKEYLETDKIPLAPGDSL